jgi:hypothetical protein
MILEKESIDGDDGKEIEWTVLRWAIVRRLEPIFKRQQNLYIFAGGCGKRQSNYLTNAISHLIVSRTSY